MLVCIGSMLIGLFLALSCLFTYAYFSKKDVYDGFVSGQVELLFDRLNDEGLAAYAEAEGVVVNTADEAWGTRENPYVISNVRHLYNLSELQNLGYFEKKHLSKNTATDLSNIPYFVISTPEYQPVAIDGDGYRAISPIGTEEYPFIGSVKGATGAPCTAGGYSAEVSILYNLRVSGDPNEPDVGLFGNVGFLGTPPAENSEDMTFRGTPSVLSCLVLHDVTVTVDYRLFDAVEAFLDDIILGKGGHRYSFSELYNEKDNSLYYGVPHENHHIGILAGHVSYTKVEYISVFYSSGDIAAIDLLDVEPVDDVAPNYFSAAGILGFIYNMNPEYDLASGSMTGGSGSNTSDLYYGIIGGGGLGVGDKAGYVLAKTIYNAYHYANGAPLGEGDTFLIKNATDESGTPLCEEWVSNGQKTGQHYFYDGVFTFALSSQEDAIVDTFADTPPTISLGENDPSKWSPGLSSGEKILTAYLRPITTDSDLADAVQANQRLVVMHEATTSQPVMLSLYNGSVSKLSGKLNQRFTTAGKNRKYTDAETLTMLLEEYDEDREKFLQSFRDDVDDPALIDAIMASLRAGDGAYYALRLDSTTSEDADPKEALKDLREQYKIYATLPGQSAHFSGETPVTADDSGAVDYYDYASSTYAGYFYYTGSLIQGYSYYWQPKTGGAPTSISGNRLGPSRTFSDTGTDWQGEDVFSASGYTGVVINGNEGTFYDSNNAANANGGSLRKPISGRVSYFYRPVGEDAYYYMTDTQKTNPLTITSDHATGSTTSAGLPYYEVKVGGTTYKGILLDRYSLYNFYSPGADNVSLTSDDNYMRMIMADYGFFNGSIQYTLWNGADGDVGTSTFKADGLISDSTPNSVEGSKDATVRFNDDGSCYIEYAIGTVAQYMAYNGDEAFTTALSRGDNTKMRIYVLETTQAINHGSLTFQPDEGTNSHILRGDEYVFWPQAVVEVEQGGTKSSVDGSITQQFSLESLVSLGWNNGNASDNGGILHAGNLDKKFKMMKGISFGRTISISSLLGGIFSGIDDFASAGMVQAPVGPEGTKANIAAGGVAFRVNKVTDEGQKIRVVVALPQTAHYKTDDGYDLGDYDRYFCLWEMPEAGSRFQQIFEADDYIERFALPRSHTFEPGTLASKTTEDEYVTVSYGGSEYRCYLNGERLLVAYEFTVREVGIYMLGVSTSGGDGDEAPMEIVYFSVGGVASTGRDGSSGSQLGTVDFVYADGENKIVTVSEDVSTNENGEEDYTTYYPSYCLLYMRSQSVDGGFIDINDEEVHIKRYITDLSPPMSSDGYQSTDSAATFEVWRLRGGQTRIVQYSRLADNIIEKK